MREEGKEIVCRIGPAHKVIGKRKEGVLVLIISKWEGENVRDSVLTSNHIK